MNLIKPFNELSKNDASIAGGKGASLGEMIQSSIPVPNGFVVLAQTFEKFIEETDINVEIDNILHDVKPEVMHTVENSSAQIQSLIKNAEMPQDIASEILSAFNAMDTKYVAVRSSATAEDSASAAWAGQLDSFLNTTADDVLEKVQLCWASLFTPRAIFYRFEKDLHLQKISVAVVVQKMVNSEKSGIAFSVHPVTEDRNQLIIEAGLGLGEAIVSGQVTPDSYVVEKEPRRILDTNVASQTRGLFRKENGGNEWKELGADGEKQVLTEADVLELSQIIMRIENHYGFPCDIEWAYENSTFYIVQSRPITTLTTITTKLSQTKILKDGDEVEVDADTGVINILNQKQGANLPRPEDYVRMFAGKSLMYILTDIFLGYYNSFGVLSIQDKGTWMSFLPRISQEKTLKAGKELYESKELFNEYNKEFHGYIESSAKYFEGVLQKNMVTDVDIEECFKLASKHFSYYSKTEFFYTDAIDQKKMALTVQEFDKLKLDGRAYLNKIIFEPNGFIRSLLRKLALQTNIPEKDLINYDIHELAETVKNGTKVEEKIIRARDTFFASKDLILIGDNARVLIDKFFSPYREISKTLKGTIAYPGKVTGRARVLVPDFNDFSKITQAVEEMVKGEILVAETTAPEIIQACKKASAIVANQGGMLSHAAIIARELKIPCIIGTDKEVLLNIKTGDELEVDANTGVVTIL